MYKRQELSIATVDPSARGKERKAFPGWLYAVLFLVFDFLAIAILQWGVTLSSTRVTLSSPLNGLGDLVSKMWLKLNFVLLLNMIMVGIVYLVLLMLCKDVYKRQGVAGEMTTNPGSFANRDSSEFIAMAP